MLDRPIFDQRGPDKPNGGSDNHRDRCPYQRIPHGWHKDGITYTEGIVAKPEPAGPAGSCHLKAV